MIGLNGAPIERIVLVVHVELFPSPANQKDERLGLLTPYV